MTAFTDEHGEALRGFVEEFLRYDTTGGREAPAQDWLADQFADLGFETYRWTADPDALAGHPSFPDDCSGFDLGDRPSVGGVLEVGDPDAGPTLVLNGHCDVVPADEETWSSDPFEPTWAGDDLTARGAADMKAGLSACAFAARHLADTADGLDGRLVVESVAGEEEGGFGAAAAALSNPYPFERDAAVIAEPTDLAPVVACEGSLMKRLRLTGQSAHAATAWRGESVLPRFERVRRAFADLERERHERVAHPLYEDYPSRVPVNCGVVEAGSWASSVPATLEAEFRIGVAPGETVDEVESEFDERLAEVVAEDEWLQEHPPEFERFSVQFEPSEVSPDEPVVRAVQDAMAARGLPDTDPRGVTYGADARHYVAAGISTVLFGPGTIEQAHFPDETVHWPDVLEAGAVLAETAKRFLSR
jgi:acetylornithine deacetylase